MREYKRVLAKVLETGQIRPCRQNTTVISLFNQNLTIDLLEGFPLLTCKKINFNNIVNELFWFLRGDSNVVNLRSKGTKIWDAWEGKGRIPYSYNWRHPKNDQIANLISGLKSDPYSRRHIVNAWDHTELKEYALPACHSFFQCYVGEHGLQLSIYIRSSDLFIGLPYNIASYALLLHLLAKECNYIPYKLHFTLGDAHIYETHEKVCREYIYKRSCRKLPGLVLNTDINTLKESEVKVINYNPYPQLKAELYV